MLRIVALQTVDIADKLSPATFLADRYALPPDGIFPRIMKYTFLVITIFAVTMGHAGSLSADTVVLDYSDFGPQSMAWETIGMEWWQWAEHGDADPSYKYQIKVVVFRGIPLSAVKRLYPVVRRTKQDYRYLSYRQAIAYLNRNITENALPELTERLRRTRKTILDKLGRPGDGQEEGSK